MKVLFPALRVSDLEASLSFYATVGFELVGRVDLTGTQLAMLALPNESEVSLELVHSADHAPAAAPALDHLAVQVDDLEATRANLIQAGLGVGPVASPAGSDGPHTATIVDPDGNHLELVEWPPGHSIAMTRADFETGSAEQPTDDRKDEGR